MSSEVLYLGVATDGQGRRYDVYNVEASCHCGAHLVATIPVPEGEPCPSVDFPHKADGSHAPTIAGHRTIEMTRHAEDL